MPAEHNGAARVEDFSGSPAGRGASRRISVIVPFLNEGDEVRHTAGSVRETAGGEVDLVLVNDGSDDGYDYRSVAREHRAILVSNPGRRGVAASRDAGVSVARTEHVLLLDAHMRFFTRGWHREMLHASEASPRTLFCTQCVSITGAGERVPGSPTGKGAFIAFDLESGDFAALLEPVWIRDLSASRGSMPEVPCVLGAAYLIRRDLYRWLGGLDGLKEYGSDEVYLSLKMWLAGGRCRLLRDLEVGHVFRERSPFVTAWPERVFNKMLICMTLFPAPLALDTMRHFTRWPGYRKAHAMCRRDAEALSRQREAYGALRTRPIKDVLGMNREWSRRGLAPRPDCSHAR
jgi:glycosyltransferase involved in cell wall biosynthesis